MKYSQSVKNRRMITAALAIALVTTSAVVSTQLTPDTKAKVLSVAEIQDTVKDVTCDDIINAEVCEIDPRYDDAVAAQYYESVASTVSQSADSSQELNRDWSKYSSDYARASLSADGKAFYDRLDTAVYEFISSDKDVPYYSSYNMYIMKSVSYSDLSLSKAEATAILHWFMFNNPQYYFLSNSYLSSGSTFYISAYDFAADGEQRAALTDSIFDTLDSWITLMNDDEVTTYQKELSAHDMICDELHFEKSSYDQSIYSALLNRGAVCTGYSGVFTAMCNASGIDAVVAFNDNHMWNLVQLDDGAWYGVDTTWNDTLNGKYIFNAGANGIIKYDAGSEHVCDSAYSSYLPVVSDVDYFVTTYDTTGSNTDSMTLSSPTNIKHSFENESVVLTWDSVPDATNYQIEVYAKDTLVGTTTIDVPMIKLNGLQNNVDLDFRVKALRVSDSVTYSSEWARYVVVAKGVSAPYGVVVTPSSDTSYRIMWQCAATGDLKYDLELYSDTAFTNKIISTTLAAKGLNVNGLRPTRECYGRLRTTKIVSGETVYSDWVYFGVTRDLPNNTPSEPGTPSGPSETVPSETTVPTETTIPPTEATSETTASTTTATAAPAEPETLNAPTGMTYTRLNASSVTVTWNAVTGADKYEISICRNADGSGKVTGTTISNTGICVRNITESSRYYMQVRAIDVRDGESYYSNWATIGMFEGSSASSETTVTTTQTTTQTITQTTTQPTQNEPEEICEPLTLQAGLVGSIYKVSWSPVANASRYDIQISLDNYNTIAVNTSLRGTAVSLSNVKAGRTYYVRVRAVGTVNGQTCYSNWASTYFQG